MCAVYKKTISLIIPVYNEEETIEIFLKHVRPVLLREDYFFEFIFVNDGSNDDTFLALLTARKSDQRIKIIDLSRNFGKEYALAAGFKYAQGDAIIPIDVDLQDSPCLISTFLRKWEEGYEMVIGVRTVRSSDSFFKRVTANLFYNLFNIASKEKIICNAGDFRLLDRKVVEVLNLLPERVRFTKGLYAWAGFRQVQLPYERAARAAGKSKWSFWGLWNFALDGITGFSTLPLRIWSYIGFICASIGFIYAAFLVFRTLFLGRDIPGYPSLMVVILCVGGLILTSLGIIGEYLGRIFVETKQRPLYIVRDSIGFKTEADQSASVCPPSDSP
ncbi:glycosyltransferase family 2 protein [Desulfovibrio desulfuricans]|uniref:glycosyltransferase family 2 protein n=1 Tax=Desulfovibrio desulfuricans TaxID=876 RepID=UPI001AE64718|nr:glycosyltransferase family 2 protein [Desulfovibrio desulfuricans]QTO39616.1 glycosyltransferase family 2 protein [Desulfovibrio desulfuricans]